MKYRQKFILVVAAVLFAAGSLAGCSQARDAAVDEELRNMANEINAQCPMTIDQDTRLDNAIALQGKTFQYNYTLVNYAKSALTAEQIQSIEDAMRPSILNILKSSSQLKELRDNNVTFKYLYRSNDGYELMILTFTPSDYK